MMKCAICKENVAVIFMTRINNGIKEPVGLCIPCAQKQGVAPLNEMLSQSGMNQKDFENLNEQMSGMLGDVNMDELMGGLNRTEDSEDKDKDGKPDQSAPLMQFLQSALSAMNPSSGGQPLGTNTAGETVADPASGALDGPGIHTAPPQAPPREKRSASRKNLDAFGTNLNDRARMGKIDRVIGREKEIERVIQILNRRNKNNPVLIGEPGVGKTAIAEGLAVRVVEGRVPAKLAEAEIYMLDLAAVVAGTQFRGQFEARMKAIIDEARAAGTVILVIDEVHSIVGAGEAEGGAMNAANILKPALARGDVQIIGATTLEDYRRHIEKDAALERRFQPVIVREPSVEESIEIVKGIKHYYEDHHQVRYSDEVLESAVTLASRYIHDRFLPDKAIDVLDEAGSRVNLRNDGLLELGRLQTRYQALEVEMEQAAVKGDYARAADFKTEECRLQERIAFLSGRSSEMDVTLDDIANVVEGWTGIPVQRVSETEAGRLLKLEERLHARVIGQNTAVSALSRAIRRTRADLRTRKRPSSFLFVGPTGVGKTELAKALAQELFGSENALVRLDMSEYMEKHTVSKLIGAPPGYIGFDQGGQLTEKVRRNPYSVLLLDEIEKAHPDVFNMLLQIMEDGRLTDSNGRTVGFENTVIIMTSNAGTSFRSGGIGFGGTDAMLMEKKVNEAVREIFRPEFLNRIDEIVIFDVLTRDELGAIVNLMLNEVISDLMRKNIRISFTDEARAFLLERGYDPKFGARPLRKTVQRHVEDEMAEWVLTGRIVPGDLVEVTSTGSGLQFDVRKPVLLTVGKDIE
jgi:ATP-dependent Clp protease ATP-binding subunit ClpA